MIKSYKLILFLSLITTSIVWAMPDAIEITSETAISAQPIFGRDQYDRGQLNPGSRAEILSFNTNHSDGVSIQIRVSDGPDKGKIGWVYLPSEKSKRSFNVLDRDRKTVNIPDSSDELKSSFVQFNKTMQELPVAGVYSKAPELVDIKSDKEVWDGFMQGELKVDEASSSDHAIAFSQVQNNDGLQVKRKYAAPISPKHVAAIPSAVEKASQGELDCEEDPVIQGAKASTQFRWLPGCDVLKGGLSDGSREKLEQCYNSIRTTLSGGKKLTSKDRARIFPMFYSKLNPVEQEFMASVVTSVGEAGNLAPPPEEMVAILMVLNNRKEYAQEKGFHNANMLDAALQSSQFSMYNKGAHHWSDALNNDQSDVRVDNAIFAYVRFKNLDLSKTPTYKKVYHYHTNHVSPAWKASSKVVPLTLNGVTLRQSRAKGVRHIYYRDIGWSFSHNPWSKK